MIDLEQVHRPPGLVGCPGLACAILLRAARDIAAGNGHSRGAGRFLRSQGCETLLANLLDVLSIQGSEPGTSSIDIAHEMLGGLLARHAGGL